MQNGRIDGGLLRRKRAAQADARFRAQRYFARKGHLLRCVAPPCGREDSLCACAKRAWAGCGGAFADCVSSRASVCDGGFRRRDDRRQRGGALYEADGGYARSCGEPFRMPLSGETACRSNRISG
ncbi:hypothetical protein SDC9_141677 [bioreactor metagenome]|uniref:Uncharacterized protein n=1 Tax=bioreactor metagenome TaxID=1076179 RepID=A0A645DYZ6_9ZZZZ